MKSDLSNESIDIEKYSKIFNIKQLSKIEFYLPKENSKRTLVLFEKKAKTNLKYPRSYNEIKKKNL